MSKPSGKLYMITRFTHDRKTGFHVISSEDGRLFANGRLSEFKKEDLPEWYVYGRYWKMWGYLSAKGVKDLRYKPASVKFNNHAMRDDSLYVSFDKPIEIKPDPYYGWEDVKNYFVVFGGWDIVKFINAVRKYSPKFDTAPVERMIKAKLTEWRENWSDEHEAAYLTDEFIDKLFSDEAPDWAKA